MKTKNPEIVHNGFICNTKLMLTCAVDKTNTTIHQNLHPKASIHSIHKSPNELWVERASSTWRTGRCLQDSDSSVDSGNDPVGNLLTIWLPVFAVPANGTRQNLINITYNGWNCFSFFMVSTTWLLHFETTGRLFIFLDYPKKWILCNRRNLYLLT